MIWINRLPAAAPDAPLVPQPWENQDCWNGGLVRTRGGGIRPKMGSKWRILAKIFADMPEIDDYYEPFTFDHLQKAPELEASPTARPRSLIPGERIEKI